MRLTTERLELVDVAADDLARQRADRSADDNRGHVFASRRCAASRPQTYGESDAAEPLCHRLDRANRGGCGFDMAPDRKRMIDSAVRLSMN